MTLAVGFYPIIPVAQTSYGFGGFTGFLDRQGSLLTLDVVAGMLLMVLVLEATRRTTGLVLPIVCLVFFAYAYYGGYLPISWSISHIGLNIEQIVNALYNEASGFFGVPLDVAATYIVLFTIYGAVLEKMGAGRFFVEFSFALFRKSGTAPGRTVATSGFLLGTVSGSGTATTVTLGSFAWPILKRAGYPKEAAGGMLAASGIGAILSPPTMGAAAFIIAEYLGVSYISVLGWAVIPTLLYYLGIFIAVEIDARRFGARRVELSIGSPWQLLARSGYHFISLGVIVFFLAIDVPPFKAVVYATVVAALFGLAEALLSRRPVADILEEEPDEDSEGEPERLSTQDSLLAYAGSPLRLSCGGRPFLPSRDRGLRGGRGDHVGDRQDGARPDPVRPADQRGVGALAERRRADPAVRDLRGRGHPHPRARRARHRVLHPQLGDHRTGLISLGVDSPAVAMFIFYYAVLSEVSPPTALAAVAASAITGGKVIPTMWQAGKYTLPAFLAPLAFVVTDNGQLLLGRGDIGGVLGATVVCGLAVCGLAVATTGWMLGPTRPVERLLSLGAALLLLYLVPMSIAIGAGMLAAAIVLHLITRGRNRSTTNTTSTPDRSEGVSTS